VKNTVKAIYLLMLLKTNNPHNLHEEPLLFPFYDLFDEVCPWWGEFANNDKELAKYIVEDMELENVGCVHIALT